jgi:hypothetical protein
MGPNRKSCRSGSSVASSSRGSESKSSSGMSAGIHRVVFLVERQQDRAAHQRRVELDVVVAAQGPQPQVELQDDLVARIPGSFELQIAPRRHVLDGTPLTTTWSRGTTPGSAPAVAGPRQGRRLRRTHLDFHGPVARVVGGLDERPGRTVRQLDLGLSRSVVVQVQTVLSAEHRPLTDQAQGRWPR